MKKTVAIIIICTMFLTTFSCVGVYGQKSDIQSGFEIVLNGVKTDYNSVIHGQTHCVPMRGIFETMGASVFYRSRDHKILILTRDGDIIEHIIGDVAMTVNGAEQVFAYPSVLENNETYIPIDMVSAALCPDEISYDNHQLSIHKYLFMSDYHKMIQEVLDVCKDSNFYPEQFQRYINYHIKMPAYTVREVIFRVNLGLDYPFYENVTTIGQPYELLVLVNKYNQLPSNFEQYNLVNMNRAYTASDAKQYLLAGVAYEKYIEMADAARNDGLSMRVVSAYRTENYQRSLYNNKVRATGKVNADDYSARPGFSEHQTGLAVDINSTRGSFEYTAEFRWLQQHAHEYGFILRYPKGKEWITGYSYEPWHYRYVGVDAAKIIYEEGITYEEYYAKYVSVNEFR